MQGQPEVYQRLNELGIVFEYTEHPPVPTIEEAVKYWKTDDSAHCKNLFFRNHKGDRHYLVLLDHRQQLNIHDLEKRLKQGKLSFASEQRMQKYLGLKPGSVSPFGLINDKDKHVHVFIDQTLQQHRRIAFHPNLNTATLYLDFNDFMKYISNTGNTFEFIQLFE